MNRVFALGVLSLVSLLLASCGGGSETRDISAGSSSPTSLGGRGEAPSATASAAAKGKVGTEAGLKTSVEAITNRYFEKNDVRLLYELLTRACREKDSFATWAGKVGFGRAMVAGFYNVDPEDIRVASVTVRDFTPSRADVSVALRTKDGKEISRPGDEWVAWYFEDGAWRADDCAA